MKPKFRCAAFFSTIIPVVVCSTAARATPLYWDGNGTTAGAGNTTALLNRTWGTFAAWNSDSTGGAGGAFLTATLNTDDLFFVAGPSATSGAVNYTVTVSGAQVANSLNFQAQAATTISGGTSITLGNGTTGAINVGQFAYGAVAQGAVTINTSMILNGANTWTNNSAQFLTTGNSSTSGNIDNAGFTVTADGTGTTRVFGSLSGSGGIIKNGTGKLVLGGQSQPTGLNHTYTGSTVINAGVLQIQALDIGTGNIQITGGYLSQYFGGAFTRALGSGAGEIQITGGVSGFSMQGSSGSFAITGTGSNPLVWGSTFFAPTEFILQGADANVTATGTFSNNIDLSGADRTIRSDQGAGTGSGIFSGIISNSTGTAGLIKVGVGRHTLSGANSYNGGTTISEGTLRFDTRLSMPASGTVTVADGATLGVTVASNGTTWGAGTGVAGIAGLTSTANGGQGFGGQTGAVVDFNGNSRLELNVTANTTESNDIGNGTATSIALIKAGTGTSVLTLSGNNSYTGGTFLDAGILSANSANALGTSGDITFRGGSLRYNVANAAVDYGSRIKNSTSAIILDTNSQNVTLTGVTNTNTGGLTKSGAGTLTLAGTNAYSGTTTISAGGIVLNGGATVSGSGVSFAGNNTSLTVTGGGSTTIWNNGGAAFGTANTAYSNIQVLIDGDGTAGSAVITNVGILNWGRTATNSTILLTNGGQMNVNGEVRLGNPFYSTAGGANMTIEGGAATSTFTGNSAQAFYIGYGERRGSNNNVVTVGSGGVLTSVGNMFVGHVNNSQNAGAGPSTANRLTVTGTGTASMTSVSVGYAQVGFEANANVVEVTSGGALSTSGVGYIGRAAIAGSQSNANTLTVTGAGSSWDAGNQTVYVGHTNNATAISNDNVLTIGTGGSMTNVGNLIVGFGPGTATGNQLVVDGSLSATTVNVSTANRLSGSGTIVGSVVISGTLAAGNSIESLTTGSLTLQAASTFAYELNMDAATGVAGDLTAVNGSLNLDLGNAAILTLAELGSIGSWADGDKLTLISYNGAWNGGLFNSSNGTVVDDSTFSFSGASWTFNYNDTTGGLNFLDDQAGATSFVTMTAAVIPEPNVALLGAIGVLALLRRRRA